MDKKRLDRLFWGLFLGVPVINGLISVCGYAYRKDYMQARTVLYAWGGLSMLLCLLAVGTAVYVIFTEKKARQIALLLIAAVIALCHLPDGITCLKDAAKGPDTIVSPYYIHNSKLVVYDPENGETDVTVRLSSSQKEFIRDNPVRTEGSQTILAGGVARIGAREKTLVLEYYPGMGIAQSLAWKE